MDRIIQYPIPRSLGQEGVGVTCASCHLTPDGKIRGSYDPAILLAPHDSVLDPNMRTSVMCAYCHSFGVRVVGKQTQTYYEWRDDYLEAGLGQKQCQDCHMPQDVRELAEDWGQPRRIVGKHLWLGSHSPSLIRQGLILSLKEASSSGSTLGTPLEVHVQNIAAAHSVPTGSNRRGIWLTAQVIDRSGRTVAANQWLFAAWFSNRPDDATYLDADKLLPFPYPQNAQIQADVQGPHETPIRAGEERVLTWTPQLPSGNYTVLAILVYDLDRYNDRTFTQDQTEMARTSISIQVL